MPFNTLTFLFFFVSVFAIYWSCLKNNRLLRNSFLLVSSYVFYGWWDWRFLSLIIASSAVDFLVGLQLLKSTSTSARRMALGISLVTNLGLLFIFKYFNFFAESLTSLLTQLNLSVNQFTLEVVLPVGISFYTFQTLSYSIDVYRRKIPPTKDPVAFFAYVSFFPQLVAGPIERAGNLLPQFQRERIQFDFEACKDGLRMILWGLFLKAVLADNLAFHVDQIFQPKSHFSGSTRALGLVYFAFQIFGDFAGYSLMARGLARLLGFQLMVNFRAPYFSRDIAEFWRRWHISLSSWFRDYIYIPLGGSKKGKGIAILNIFVVFMVSGLWHGAEWTFIFWGLINALLFIPLFLAKRNRVNIEVVAKNRRLPTLFELSCVAATFCLVCLAWTFFRAENLSHAMSYLGELFSPSLFSLPDQFRSGIVWIALVVIIEWIDRDSDFPLKWTRISKTARWAAYLILANIIYFRGHFGDQNFIYFQF